MIFVVIWVVLLVYALFLAPGVSSNDPILEEIFKANWDAIDPLVFTVFNSLGLFPLVFLTLFLLNDRYRWPAWPFVLLSFGVGSFTLLPYLAFGKREPVRSLRTWKWLVRILSSTIWLLFVLLMFVFLLIPLFQPFSLEGYKEAFMASKLVSVMTVDFFVLWGLAVYCLHAFYPHMRLKGLSWIPIVGPIVVLLVNPGKRVRE